ncbi:MAG: chromate resistance protein [bacterium]|uniref:Chromate resistance protein n=1 Tax=Candidatus Methylomirabilis tolerans TaxID=3123416 RepID=A0AAJ1AK12_9BACT|nr:chromate resistance protein [Candidatus Methylomirabilis sp.]
MNSRHASFDTSLKRVDPQNKALRALAEIVHDADLKDAKFGRDEAKGIDAVLKEAKHERDYAITSSRVWAHPEWVRMVRAVVADRLDSSAPWRRTDGGCRRAHGPRGHTRYQL